ncbi:hypothetical protein ACQEUU_29225 [Nonomuraea sp. CA-218870]|uniref:hypothetical protein n=1 Tax=Nonomuraea sp. CA-218870 TaxID=3239998 RepID=UPI003D8A41DB
MAHLTAVLRTTTHVDHRSFDLLDDGGPQDAVREFGDPARWLFTGRNSVIVVTLDGDPHDSTLTIEAWDGEPPAHGPAERTAQATVHLDSGQLEVNPLVEDDADWLDVGGPGTYHLRVSATGEDYLFQLWPSTGRTPS